MARSARLFAAVVAFAAISALVLQYALLLRVAANAVGPWFATLRFFSYFTILSNLAVALVAMAAAFGHAGWFDRPRVRGGVALCIGVTCAVYHFVLAATWAPTGLQWLVDVALHYVVPALYWAWWVACVPHGRLAWTDALRWLAVPLAYLAWTLLRGAWVHEYPYPFIDVDALGGALVVRNAGVVAALFLCVGLVLVAFDRMLGRHSGTMKASQSTS